MDKDKDQLAAKTESTHSSGNPVPEAANYGLLRPPFIYLASIALGLMIRHIWPARLIPPFISTLLGLIVTVGAVSLFVSAVRTFRAAGTPIPGNRPTTTIVRKGPYRFTRNPIYLAFSVFHVGLSLWINSLGLLLALIPAVVLMSLVVIPREERYLAAQFPAEYLPYQASVRRWL